MYDLYDFPLYRPPSEAYSLIIQITLGCSHNRCTFCSMYKDKKFIIKQVEETKKEIDAFRAIYKNRNVEKIFLADGDALVVPTKILAEILDYIKLVFPECKRVSVYGTAIAIHQKSIEDLKLLYEKGLTLVYLGVESGDDEALKFIKKGVSSEKIVELSKKIMSTGIDLSITLIAGLMGKFQDNKNHAINSAKIIQEISPKYASILNLRLYEGTELYKLMQEGKYDYLEGVEVLKEMKLTLASMNKESFTKKVIFRANHASNYLNLKGNLPEDIPRMIAEIDNAIENEAIDVNNYRFL
ncbi:MAG: B12-binding domain-containing radical SAM protein [Fusobacterium sp.]|nr:B12-binding domain-containing radical SAM protein [Fusobacterium sp.]